MLNKIVQFSIQLCHEISSWWNWVDIKHLSNTIIKQIRICIVKVATNKFSLRHGRVLLYKSFISEFLKFMSFLRSSKSSWSLLVHFGSWCYSIYCKHAEFSWFNQMNYIINILDYFGPNNFKIFCFTNSL